MDIRGYQKHVDMVFDNIVEALEIIAEAYGFEKNKLKKDGPMGWKEITFTRGEEEIRWTWEGKDSTFYLLYKSKKNIPKWDGKSGEITYLRETYYDWDRIADLPLRSRYYTEGLSDAIIKVMRGSILYRLVDTFWFDEWLKIKGKKTGSEKIPKMDQVMKRLLDG